MKREDGREEKKEERKRGEDKGEGKRRKENPQGRKMRGDKGVKEKVNLKIEKGQEEDKRVGKEER